MPLIHPISNKWLDIYQHNIPTTSPLINTEKKMEIKRRTMTKKLKTKIVTQMALLLVKFLVSALTFQNKCTVILLFAYYGRDFWEHTP